MKLSWIGLLGLLGVTAFLGWSRTATTQQKMADEESALVESLKKARVNGKYRMLLRQFRMPQDRDRHGAFADLGFRSLSRYAGLRDLPDGHWVYVAPYWYLWRERAGRDVVKRPWGPEQATGKPDTEEAGDFNTAWASQTPDGQDEWLLIEYPEPIRPREIVVHETYNPGAVERITAFKLDGTEVEVWKGQDPGAGKEFSVSVFPFKGDFKTNRIKLFIASTRVAGWNEIDAVGLRDKDKKIVWASAVEASSTFGQQAVDPRERRIRELEREVEELKELVKKLEQLLDKKK